MLRPVLASLLGLSTVSCGVGWDDANRFETLAHKVAEIPLEGAPSANPASPVRMADETGLRPALSAAEGALRVEVMDPHDLWDARDGLKSDRPARSDGLRDALVRATPAMAEAAAPVARQMAEGALRRAVGRETQPAAAQTLRDRTTIQLGAYSTRQAAQDAWATVSGGAARQALKGLSPVFETVLVNGRPFTRLKVAAPSAAASAICRAAEVTDPWCARSA